jgi:hypothetical protein
VSLLQSNIEVQRQSDGLMGVHHWNPERVRWALCSHGVRWAHWSSMLMCGGITVCSLQSNIVVRRESGGFIEVQH